MQNITAENMKSRASRLGFHNKKTDELIEWVKSSNSDEFHPAENKLLTKKNKLSEKIKSLEVNHKSIVVKVGETLIESGSLLIAITGIFVSISLFYIGLMENIMIGVIYLGLSTIGGVIINNNNVSNDFWKPFLFVGLSLVVGALQFQIIYDQGYGIVRSLVFGLAVSVMSYFLNGNIFNAFQALKSQLTAIWYRLIQFINGLRRFYTKRSYIHTDKKLNATIMKKELMLDQKINLIKYHYDIGKMASEINNNNNHNNHLVDHYQLSGKAIAHAN